MTFFNIALILHIVGIVIIAGTTFTNFFIARQFWNCIEADKQKAVIINSSAVVFGRLTGIGGMLTILSGVSMVAALHGAIASQIWFQIKMALVVLIILNATFFARTQNRKLQQLLFAGTYATNELLIIRSRMNFYYAVQFILLLIIFILSVFRFN